VFCQRRARGERLLAVRAADALSTVGVHAFMSTEIGELRVGLETDVAAERLHTAVDMLMLLQTARRGERLAAAATLVLSPAGRRHYDHCRLMTTGQVQR